MNRRLALLGLTVLGSAMVLPAARAQASAKVPRVAIFTFGSRFNARARTEAFMKAMRELGYEEGRDVLYEWRFANGQPDLMRELAIEVAREQFDVVVSVSSLTTEALLQATSTIPIVMATVEDPVISGFVKSPARPDTNVTGRTSNSLEQIPKHMELLLRAVPGIGKAAALVNPANTVYAAYRSRLEWAAKSSRVRLVLKDATNYRDIERAFNGLAAAPVGGMLVRATTRFTRSATRSPSSPRAIAYPPCIRSQAMSSRAAS